MYPSTGGGIAPGRNAWPAGNRVERRVAERVRAQRWYLRFPRGAPVAIFLLVSAITALSVFAIERVESQRAEAQHQQMADNMTAAIERLANANTVYLRAGASLMTTRDRVSRSAFRDFARQLELDESLHTGGAVGFAELTPRSALPALVNRLRREVDPHFTVHPASTGRDVMPMIYVEPESRENAEAVGFDAFSEPVRRAAIERAIATGRPTASGALQLISGRNARRRIGFGIFVPVFDGVQPGRRLRGAIGRAFNAQSFLDTALTPAQLQDYGVAIYDDEAREPVLLAFRGPHRPDAQRIVRLFDFANHRMRLDLIPPATSALSSLSLLSLVFGMMVAALLLVVARLMTQHAAEDRAALAWFEEQASIRNSLTRELNHRVKNTLANVLSIVALTRRRTTRIDEFAEALTGRIRALSATHDLLTQSEWGTTPISAVITAELAPYAQDSDAAVRLRGPHVELAPNDALSLGLAVHELATNATKYGALSSPDGTVMIDWHLLSDKLVRIDWAEQGGPPVAEHRRRGFGTELIEKIVAHELRNPVDLQFNADGVRCSLIVPVRLPAAFQIRMQRGTRARGQGNG